MSRDYRVFSIYFIINSIKAIYFKKRLDFLLGLLYNTCGFCVYTQKNRGGRKSRGNKKQGGATHEKNLSAQEETEKQGAWLQKKNGYRKRQKSSQEKTRQGKSSSDLLIESRSVTYKTSDKRLSRSCNFYRGFCFPGIFTRPQRDKHQKTHPPCENGEQNEISCHL